MSTFDGDALEACENSREEPHARAEVDSSIGRTELLIMMAAARYKISTGLIFQQHSGRTQSQKQRGSLDERCRESSAN
jgi:hypothetical protein